MVELKQSGRIVIETFRSHCWSCHSTIDLATQPHLDQQQTIRRPYAQTSSTTLHSSQIQIGQQYSQNIITMYSETRKQEWWRFAIATWNRLETIQKRNNE